VSSELFIGLISGTSRDGLDAALFDFETGRPELLHAVCTPYPPRLRQEIDALVAVGTRPEPHATRLLDRQLGHFFARAASDLLSASGLKPADIRAIGSHGQTVWHEPGGARPVSMQLGNGFVIANVTRVVTITDFRTADVAAGGQGAPLAPLLHRELFRSDAERRAVLNLGGIANVTRLDPGGRVTGFDCGPANCLLDLWATRHIGRPYDEGGTWAARGEVHPELLRRLLDEPFFQEAPPKSTGLETFNARWLDRRLQGLDARPEDVQRTLVELTARTVADGLALEAPPHRLLVCGGGVHNAFLMACLSDNLQEVAVQSTAQHGVHPDWVEASLFAWLARERLLGHEQDTRDMTGARHPVLLGEVNTP